MFSPDVNDSSEMLIDTFTEILNLKNYASMCNSLRIGKPGDIDPAWLVDVRSRISLLSNSMSSFMSANPDIFSGLLYPFINYQTLFSAFAQQSKQIKGNDQWLAALGVLKDALTAAATTSNTANVTFQKQFQAVSNIQPLLDQSIQAGWATLASEEQAMVKIATALGKLQQAVQDISGDLTASDISNGKSYVQSTVTIAYDLVMTAELSIPFLSFAAILYTVGSSAYQVITTSEEIQKYWGEIDELQNEASAEAQAAAGTKATIQVLSNVSRSFLTIGHTLPRLTQMWQAEAQKVVDAINAINAGSNPSLLFDLQTMSIANASWATLLGLVQKIQAPIAVGEPVTIDTSAVKAS